MIITFMQYTDPVYRNRLIMVDYKSIHIRAREITPDEMSALEDIARQGTYLARLLGMVQRNVEDKIVRFWGFRNEVRFEMNGEETNIHIRGSYAPTIAHGIEDLPFVRFEVPKRDIVRYIG